MSSTSRPRRGRPPQTEAEAEAVRARIVAAAGQVFTEHGSRGLSVARIIDAAGLARPTFYRYYRNAAEPLHVLLAASDDELVRRISDAVDAARSSIELGIGVIDAYLAWAHSWGSALRPLFAELHDPSSPVSGHREVAIDQVRKVLLDKIAELGRPAPHPLVLDTLIQTCEFVVYRMTSDGDPSEDLAAQARMTMIRTVLALVGQREDYDLAAAVPGLLFPE